MMDLVVGAVYWVEAHPEGIAHPYVVLEVGQDAEQDAVSVQLCAVTTNLQRVRIAGNVLLRAGEANLPKTSVVEVGKQVRLAPSALGAYIGQLAEQRLAQIEAGVRFQQRAFLPPTE